MWVVISYIPMLKQQVMFWFIKHRDMVPIHLDHIVERYGLFVIIVMGESVTGMTIVPRTVINNRLYVLVLFGFALVLCLKLLYFDVDTQSSDHHALKRSRYGLAWTWVHTLIIIAMALIGSGMESVSEHQAGEGGEGGVVGQLVDAEVDPSHDSFDYITPRWFICGGTAVCFVSFSALRLLHVREAHSIPAFEYVLYRLFCVQIVTQNTFALVSILIAAFSPADLDPIIYLAALAVMAILLVVANLCDEFFLLHKSHQARKVHRQDAVPLPNPHQNGKTSLLPLLPNSIKLASSSPGPDGMCVAPPALG